MYNTLTRMGASAASDYEIERSLRHNSADSTYFSRTPSGTSSRTTFTFSFWTKFTSSDDSGAVFGVWQDNTSRDTLRFLSGQINLQCGQHSENVQTSGYFRDPTSWYHIVCAVDTTQAASGDRVVIYVNGVSQALGTNTLSQNREFKINTDNIHVIGCRWLSGAYDMGYNGYLADFHFVDGSKLTPSSFAETNTDTGQWVPKKYSGSHGTNGYHLKFDDNSGTTATTLGKDSSGNGNNFTPNNYSVTSGETEDSLLDTPFENFCTLNMKQPVTKQAGTVTNGALDVAGDDYILQRANWHFGPGGITSGKWMWEVKNTSSSGNTQYGAYTGVTGNFTEDGGEIALGANKSWASTSSFVYKDYTATSGTEPGAGNQALGTMTFGLDLDAQTLKYYYNGSLLHTDSTIPDPATTEIAPFIHSTNSGGADWANAHFNFGQRGFSYGGSSGLTAAGYKALSTANISITIDKSSDYFDNVLYSGTGSSNSITGLDFSPNLVIAKRRNTSGHSHLWIDTIRGGNTSFQTETVDPDNTNANRNMTFDSNGVTWTSDSGNVNASGGTYLLSAWKESATAGFDMVEYTGNATGSGNSQTISHSLGVVPEMMIVKARSTPYSGGGKWTVYHKDIPTPTENFLNLNTDTGKVTTSTDVWNQVAPTSSNFQVGYEFDTNKNGVQYMAYLWSSVAGFSKVGTYEGINNADGPYVHLGFRAQYLVIKNVDSDSRPWIVKTPKAPGYNPVPNWLRYDTTAEEVTNEYTDVDFLSNGFKLRQNGSYTNNVASYVYLAVAAFPYKYANAF